MSENLIRLRRPAEPIHFPEQVALLRAALAQLGYTASDQDIQEAYNKLSNDEWAAGWYGIDNAEQAMWRARSLTQSGYLEPAE